MPAALGSYCCLLFLKNWFTVFTVFTVQICLYFTVPFWIQALCFAYLIVLHVLDHHSFCNIHSQKCCILMTGAVIVDKINLWNVLDYSLIPIWSRNNSENTEEHISFSGNKNTMPDSLKNQCLGFCYTLKYLFRYNYEDITRNCVLDCFTVFS